MLWRFLFATLLVSSVTALNLPGVPKEFTETDDVLSAISDDIARRFADEYVQYLQTGIRSATLRQLSQQLAASHSKKDMFTKDYEELGMADQFLICTTCRASVNVISRMFLSPGGELAGEDADDQIKKLMLDFCDVLNIQTQEVCSGLFDVNWPFIKHVMHTTSANSRTLCGTLPIKLCQVHQNEYNFVLNIDNSMETVAKTEIPKKSASDVHVLQLTDIHYDPEYVVGSLAECDEPMCCNRTPQGGVAAEKQAGYWGDFRDCDMPLHSIENAFDHIKETHKNIKYIYQTGDIVPHTVWSTTKQGNMDMITQINALIKQKFGDIPVYSCIGNHEPHPTNVFGSVELPDELNVKWLYQHLWDNWNLPAEAKDTVLSGGYYTVSPEKGFRIIALNNNDCYMFNWWLYQDGGYATKQLQWLHDTLLAAEKAGEYVHILAHIPSGSADCWTVWAREYNRLIARFSKTIGGVFNGHTHRDEMNVHYGDKGEPVGISWNGGSLTTYSYKNPNYRIYEVETTSYQVVDQETWIYDLDKANEHGKDKSPEWYQEYKFTTEYGVEDLSPAGINKLLDNMADTPALLRKYWRNRHTNAAPRLEGGCNDKCMMAQICSLSKGIYNEKERCKELQEKLAIALENEEPTVTTTEAPPKPDGAASITAFAFSTLLALYAAMKCLF